MIHRGTHLSDEVGIAGPYRAEGIVADDTGARMGGHVHDRCRLNAMNQSLTTDGGSDMMLGMRFQPGKERKETAILTIQGDNARDLRTSIGQGPGLVKGEGIDSGERFKRTAPLNSTPPRAAAESADRIAAGTDITIAQGLAATSRVAAL